MDRMRTFLPDCLQLSVALSTMVIHVGGGHRSSSTLGMRFIAGILQAERLDSAEESAQPSRMFSSVIPLGPLDFGHQGN